MFFSLLSNEFRFLFRKPENTFSVAFFSLVIVLLLSFVNPELRDYGHSKAWGYVVLVTLFGSLLRFYRTFEPEKEGALLTRLKMIPDLSLPLFFAKILANFLVIFFLEFFVMGATLFFLGVHEPVLFLYQTFVPLVLLAFGLAVLGTLCSVILQERQKKDVLFPIIFYPLVIPLLMLALRSCGFDASGKITGIDFSSFRLILAFDGLYFLASILVFEKLWRDA